ncbi:Integrase [Enterobacter kobei]|nr:Integrase [Enterobacter kobei]
MPLTDLEIRRSKPREKSYTLNDGNGLSLLIEPNGEGGVFATVSMVSPR